MSDRVALLSVHDKRGVTDFASGLRRLGFSIISTGGTRKVLEDAGIDVTEVSRFTGSPELFDGRVKTLHPKIHGGILARAGDMEEAREAGITRIDLVAVNLYPFEETARNGPPDDELLEMIDIGGPALLRASAKSYRNVVVVCDPDDYAGVLEHLANGTEDAVRKELALKAFGHTARYDCRIYDELHRRWNPGEFPQFLGLVYGKAMDLRYGENPHQRGTLYRRFDPPPSSLATAEQLWGKELSYNNILDADNALSIVRDFSEPCACVVKHINPCGVGIGTTIEEAFDNAHSADPLSAFGGIVALNRELSVEIAEIIRPIFLEVVIAPSVNAEALDILKKKKNRRILVTGPLGPHGAGIDFKNISGGLLLQDRDTGSVTREMLKTVSEREPTGSEIRSMLFGARLLKRVRSNTILFTNDKQTVGIGAGQMSRVDAVRIAGEKSKGRSKGCAMASDAFFPFRDGIDTANEFGITAVIQPGGSVRDQEVIDAVNEHGMAMVFSGMRAFWH